MAVLILGVNVVIKVDVINRLYPNGIQGVEDECPNQTFCTDGNIARIGFMNFNDANAYTNKLKDYGMTHKISGICIDFTQFSGELGLEPGCDWINLDQDKIGYFFAWLSGTEQGQIILPAGFEPDPSKNSLIYYSPEDSEKYLEFVRVEGNIRVFRDTRTGETRYVGSTRRLQEDAFESHVRELISSSYQLAELACQARDVEDSAELQKINLELSEIAKESILIATDDVQDSIFLAGIVHRHLEKWSDAISWYQRYVAKHQFNPDVWQEMGLCFAYLGDNEESLKMARRAYELNPSNPILLGNLASALDAVGKIDEAVTFIHKALLIDPSDTFNQMIEAKLIARQHLIDV